MYTDTPVPPDEPHAENPPDGAVIDYFLKRDVSGPVTLEIRTSAGRVVRKFSSADPAEPVKDVGNWPKYWFRPAQVLSTKAGLQRYAWDLHFTPPPGECSLPISATPHNTKCEPEGPWVEPGTYRAVLTVDGKNYEQTFTVRMDPRVKASAAAIQQQYALSLALYDATLASPAAAAKARALRSQLADRKASASSASEMIDALDKKLSDLAGPEPTGRGGRGGGRGGRGGAGAPTSFSSIAGQFSAPLNVLQEADEAPTTSAVASANDVLKEFATLKSKWDAIVKTDVPALNAKLKAAGAQEVKP
jgi:hypothetical protein